MSGLFEKLSITTLKTTTIMIRGLFATLCMNDTQHNKTLSLYWV